MRPSGSRLLATKFVFIAVISASAIAGFAYFQGISVRPVGAVSDAAGVRRFSLAVDSVRPEMASVDDSPWLNLRSGKAIGSEYAGTEAAISLFESGSLRPSTLIAVDANFDGLADAISGFSSGNGGVITLHRAAREAFAPESPESLAGIKRGEFPSSFEREAAVIEVPISPDFIASGRFRDGRRYVRSDKGLCRHHSWHASRCRFPVDDRRWHDRFRPDQNAFDRVAAAS